MIMYLGMYKFEYKVDGECKLYGDVAISSDAHAISIPAETLEVFFKYTRPDFLQGSQTGVDGGVRDC